MSATTSQRVERPSATRLRSRAKRPRLIRQASAWLPGRAPEPLPLQDLEQSDAIRWVDIYGGGLGTGGVVAVLAPNCRGKLKGKKVRGLLNPQPVGFGGRDGGSPGAISSRLRILHLQPGAE